MITIQRISHCPSRGSQRYVFQWKYVLSAQGSVLNVGSADDPVRLGEYATHFDYDDYSALYAQRGQQFVQGDAHRMPFADKAFDLVVCGDVLEHAEDPQKMFLECCRVTARVAVFTIFEEWRLPSVGQHIEFGTAHRDSEAQRNGYVDAAAHFAKENPGVVVTQGISHQPHINRFADKDILKFINTAITVYQLRLIEYMRAPEAVYDGHQWCNWLVALERYDAGEVSQKLESLPQVTPQGV